MTRRVTDPLDGYRVFACDVCGQQFRFGHATITHPPGHHPPTTPVTLVDEEEDTAMREHATEHGGTLDRQLAYVGPTTFTSWVEPLRERSTEW